MRTACHPAAPVQRLLCGRSATGPGPDGGCMDGIIIGEGVVLDSRPTSSAVRLLAALLDLAVLGVVVFVADHGARGAARRTARRPPASPSVVLVATITVDHPDDRRHAHPRQVARQARPRDPDRARRRRPDRVPPVARPRAGRHRGALADARLGRPHHVDRQPPGQARGRHPRRDVRRAGPGISAAARAAGDAAAARGLGGVRGHRAAARRPGAVRATVPRPHGRPCTRPHASSWAPGSARRSSATSTRCPRRARTPRRSSPPCSPSAATASTWPCRSAGHRDAVEATQLHRLPHGIPDPLD